MAHNQKTMQERMLAGELYDPFDPMLVEMNFRAQELCVAFNNAPPRAVQAQQSLLSQLFGVIGADCVIRAPFHCDYGANIFCGDRVFINHGCTILDCNTVHIGDRVLLGPNVQLYAATHPLEVDQRKEGWEFALPIEIGSDVWIGGSAVVCPGVTIGSGSTIGAGSIVVKDIPAGVVAVGNPCKVVRQL